MSTIKHNGTTYRVNIEPDYDYGAPWEECDGHGEVSEWTKRDKLPGELVLCEDRGSKRFYDFAVSMKIAKRDCWRSATNGEERRKAVMRDFEYLRGWCTDEWGYVGVTVYPLTSDGDELKSKAESLWRIESNSDQAYFDEVANDLIAQIEGD